MGGSIEESGAIMEACCLPWMEGRDLKMLVRMFFMIYVYNNTGELFFKEKLCTVESHLLDTLAF